jgi:hypothetical protein
MVGYDRFMAALALPFPGRPVLGATERRVLHAVAEALFDGCSDVSQGRLRSHVEDVDALLGAASRRVQWGLRLAIWLVRLSPVLLGMSFARLDALPVARRVAVLSALERSRWTSLLLPFVGVRTVMMLVFYEHPTELAAIGFRPHARARYTRHLTVLTAEAKAVPVPAESGVRLREDADARDGESDAESAPRIEVA